MCRKSLRGDQYSQRRPLWERASCLVANEFVSSWVLYRVTQRLPGAAKADSLLSQCFIAMDE